MLLFIDNIFRFTQAGSEVSALLGRMPSAVGYQPNLATDLGELQERITSTNKGSITAVQCDLRARRRPDGSGAGDAFAHLDGTIVLSRPIAELGIYPAVDPLDSTSRILDPSVSWARSTTGRPPGSGDAPEIQGPPGHHCDPRHGRALRGGQAHRQPGARKIQRFLSQPFFVAAQFTGTEGKFVTVADTVRGFKEILEGKHDDLPEQAFYMVGGIDEVVEKARSSPRGAAERASDVRRSTSLCPLSA